MMNENKKTIVIKLEITEKYRIKDYYTGLYEENRRLQIK